MQIMRVVNNYVDKVATLPEDVQLVLQSAADVEEYSTPKQDSSACYVSDNSAKKVFKTHREDKTMVMNSNAQVIAIAGNAQMLVAKMGQTAGCATSPDCALEAAPVDIEIEDVSAEPVSRVEQSIRIETQHGTVGEHAEFVVEPDAVANSESNLAAVVPATVGSLPPIPKEHTTFAINVLEDAAVKLKSVEEVLIKRNSHTTDEELQHEWIQAKQALLSDANPFTFSVDANGIPIHDPHNTNESELFSLLAPAIK